jgi:type II secretory pathway pseudopilin PulG
MKPLHFLSINSPAPRPLWLWRENKPESTPGHPLRGCQASRAIPACQDLAPKRRLRSTKPFHPQKGNFMQMIPVVVLVVLGVPIALAIWLIVRAVQARGRIEELSFRLSELEAEVILLKREGESAKPAEPAPKSMPMPVAATIKIAEVPPIPPLPKPVAAPKPVVPPQPPPIVAPLPVSVAPTPPRLAPAAPRPTGPAINWEQFMGVKLFAWIGGLALFLGVAFFVKYSFDNNLISRELRVAIGFVTGLGLLVGGVVMSRKNYAVLSQTLCATGVVILYAVTFACRSIYHFEFFGPLPTFLLMALITTTAFLLAIRLDAMVVAILGMLGGFLTPILLSTGQDNPLGLFGYIAILDAGLIVVALNRRWHFLTALAATGTAFMQIGWAGKFFEPEKYFEGDKILVALAVLLGFNVLYLAAAWAAKFRGSTNKWLSGSTLGLIAVALAFTAWFLTFAPLAQRPWLMFGFVFLIDLVVIALVLLDDEVAPAQPIAGLAVFGLLAAWTARSLSNELLNAALAFYFIFAVVHSVFPVLLQRRRGVNTAMWGGQIFPPLALVLVLIPIFQLAETSFLVWPFVLLVDVLAIGLAVMLASLLPVLAVMALTLAATGALIFKIPVELTGLPTSFFLLGAFAVFFVVISVWAVRKLKPGLIAKTVSLNEDVLQPENLAALLPAFSATLPFLLLIMATLRLPLANPSPVFGLALLLVVLVLGVTKIFSQDWLPAIGLACVSALECAWHFNRFDPANPTWPLTWYLIFYAVFTLFPFLFLRQFGNKVVPWAVAALAGLPQFFLLHRLVAAAYPNQVMSLLPAAFAIPPLLSLVVVLKKIPAVSPARMTQLAWFGGVALFFITLIFPIQFDRQWITIGWALEGAALLWLFHRVPHPGLRLTGAGLLVAAFVRLALNRAVFDYHLRSATPIFNWYLYTYGIVTVCLFAGARLLAPPRNLILQSNAPPILAGLGTVLAFLLLNIEIADFFSPAGSTLTFQFSGDFARDMTYSIAWALFALVLLVIGILGKIPASRYAALGLLSVTLLKLFFHDLARLGQLYRIGAFIGVAVIAMLASFAYQRFYAAGAKDKETKDETTK